MSYSVTLLPLYDTAGLDARLCAEPWGLLSILPKCNVVRCKRWTPLPYWLQCYFSRGGVMTIRYTDRWCPRCRAGPGRCSCPWWWNIVSPKQVKDSVWLCNPCKAILRSYDRVVVRCRNQRCQTHLDQSESGEFEWYRWTVGVHLRRLFVPSQQRRCWWLHTCTSKSQSWLALFEAVVQLALSWTMS